MEFEVSGGKGKCRGSGGWEWDGRWREEAGEARGEEWTPGCRMLPVEGVGIAGLKKT